MKKNKFVALILATCIVLGLPVSTVSAVPDLSDNTQISHYNLQEIDVPAPAAWGAVPSINQLIYHRQELSAFMHFGMNTFTNLEWGTGNERPSQFALANDFDAEGIVKALMDAGFKKLIITAKHHDGFCIWPSAYTEHSIKNSPYKNGQGDILAEVSAACTKYNMDMGLYLSPWDENAPSYGYYDKDGNPLLDASGNPRNGMTWAQVEELDELDYNEYYINQINEIAGNPKYGNNGRFVEWWMDGAKGSGADAQNYTSFDWYAAIQNNEGIAAGYEDDCLLFGAGAYTTVRWIGNELGYASNETWAKSQVNRVTNSINSNNVQEDTGYTKGLYNGNQWTVPECDARITPGWFYHPNDVPKTISALSEMYFRSVGHNSTLLLNFPPNRQGTLDAAVFTRLKEFGNTIKDTFDENFAASEIASISASSVRGNAIAYSPANVADGNDDTYWTMNDTETTGSITIDLGERKEFDVISIKEYIPLGQRVFSYSVEYKDGESEWRTFESGPTIGAHRLCRSVPVRGDKVRINIKGSYAVPVISEVGVYKASGGFEIKQELPSGIEFIDNVGFGRTGTWSTGTSGIGNTSMTSSTSGSTATFNFTGSKFWIVGNVGSSYGSAQISIDGGAPITFSGYAATSALSQRVYESPDLEYGLHEAKITVIGQSINLDGAYYLHNDKGMFEIEQGNYSVIAGEPINIKIKRIGNTSREETVNVVSEPGGAVQGQHYQDINVVLSFAAGESEKVVTIPTYISETQTGNLDFYLNLLSPSEGATLGFNASSKIVLRLFKSLLIDLLASVSSLQEGHYKAQNWNDFIAAKNAAQTIVNKQDVTVAEVDEAYDALLAAYKALVPQGVFTENDRFIFPSEPGVPKLLEAEFFELVPIATDKYVRLSNNSGASNGKEVNWFENGNKIKLYYYAEKAGYYTFTARFRSGRAAASPNAFVWEGENITSGDRSVYGPDAAPFRTVEFEVQITKPGLGIFYFVADHRAGPVIDKFDITLQPEYTLKGVLDSLSIAPINEGDASIQIPNVPNRFNLELIESSRPDVIDTDGKIYPQLAAVNVDLTFRLTYEGEWDTKTIRITVPPLTSNIARLAYRVTASNYHSAPYLPEYAVDGKTSTRWATQDSAMNGSWLQLEFNYPVTINKSVIKPLLGPNNYINKFNIEYWDYKADEWKIAYTGQNVGSVHTDNFPSVSSDKIRLFMVEASRPSIWEFELYYEPPTIVNMTVLPEKIAGSCAANINVKLPDESCNGASLYLMDGDSKIGSGTVSGDNGTLKLTSAPNVSGKYKIVAMLNGETVGEGIVEIIAYDANIWNAEAVDIGGKLAIKFGYTPSTKNGTFDGRVTVDGTPMSNTSIIENTVIIEDVDFADLKGGEVIVIRDVKYIDLFPSYSFTFKIVV